MKSGIKFIFPICIFGIFAAVFFLAPLLLSVFSASSNPYSSETADTGVVYHSMCVDIEWEEDRSCHVVQQIQMEFLDDGYLGQGSHGIYVDIPVNSGEKIRNVYVGMSGYYSSHVAAMPYTVEYESGFALVRLRIGDPDRTFFRGGKISGIISYDYITPVHPDGENLLDINPIGYGWMSAIEEAIVSVTYPTKPVGDVTFTTGDYNGLRNKDLTDTASVSDDGKTFTVKIENLAPFCGVRVKTEMPADVLTAYSFGSEIAVTASIGAALFVAVVLMMLFLGRDKPITPTVDFYPPRIDGKDGLKHHMLPVQMGKLIDGSCSTQDVTSLIFYWASKGFIAIEEDGDDTVFVKLKDVEAVTVYEENLFNRLFSSGKKDKDGNTRVKLSSLKGKFADALFTVKASVNTEYGGNKLYVKRNTLLSVFAVVLCALYGVLAAGLCTLRISSGFFNFAGLFTLVPVAAAAGFGTLIVRYYAKFSVKKRRALLAVLFSGVALLAVGIIFLMPADAMCLTEKIPFALFLSLSSAITPFLTRRTEFYTKQLDSILGFRDFIRDAEKDRLELLLKDDPQYYYNILPYANVLGVSGIWADKFKDLAVEPPAYYRGGNIGLFDVIVINRLCSSVGSSLSYVQPKASSGSFSGGGGRSSGGGGSFGGFGGGGGGRW